MKSVRLLRRVILCRLYDHIEEQYGIERTREEFVEGDLSIHQIDAILAFKSDPLLDELRMALGRLDDGSFGICLGCKGEISQELLQRDPVRRVCSRCERQFSRAAEHEHEPHAEV